VIPGIKEYLAEFTSDIGLGKRRLPQRKRLIPLPEAERKQVGENVKALKTVSEVK